MSPVTYATDLPQVTVRRCPQYLDCDLPSQIFPPQYIRKPTATVRHDCCVVGQIDLHRQRKQIVLATNLVQKSQGFPLDNRIAGEDIERLVSGLE